MARDPKPTGRFRNFLRRISPFLTRKQQKEVIREAARPAPARPPSGAPSRNAPAAQEAPSRPAAPATATASERDIYERERRVDELRRIEQSAREEREAIQEKNVAQSVPTFRLKDFREEKGFTYNTWFKAVGSFGQEWGGVDADSPHLLVEDDDEARGFGVDAAFTSRSKLGKVKWKGRVERETIIKELNDTAFQGDDFREIYPTWEYRYFLTKQIGDVVVGIFEHKARYPLNAKGRAQGYQES